MKRKRLTRLLAVVLSAVLCLQMSELSIFAASAGSFDPTSQINLTVPEALQDGNNYFFIREAGFSISEKSTDQLYIPVQRTGNTGEAADVTLKIIDMSARYGVNYKASLYDDRQKPEAVYEGTNVRDLFEHAEEQDEVEAMDENDLGEIIQTAGGAELVTPEGDTVGTINAVPLDEDGNPVQEEQNGESQVADTGSADIQTGETASDGADPVSAENEVQENAGKAVEPSSPSQKLISARNASTGTISDRQKMEGGESFLSAEPGELVQAQQERELTDEDLTEESYPGREFQVHFEPGQTARFLVIDPEYSSAADGDCAVMLMIKGLPEGTSVPDEWNLRNVLITDEDEPEPVIISMAAEEIRAEDGVASVTVTRSGQMNNLVGVMLSSQDGSAVAGDDYSGVGAKLWFSMGIKDRTVDIPVGHGAEEKDFTLTISSLADGSDVTIGQASSHVIIPAASVEEDVQLMEDDNYGDIWNLRDRKSTTTGKVTFSGDNAVKMRTENDETQTQFISLHTDNDYAWDGIHVEYGVHTWYSMVKFCVEWWDYEAGKWKSLTTKDHGDCSWKNGQTVDVNFGALKAPYIISLDDWCYEVHNWFRDSYTEVNVNGVYPIKRNFTVKMQNTKALPFEGMTDKQVLEQYQPVILDSGIETTQNYKTLDNFSISRQGPTEWARLKALYAVSPDGKNKQKLADGDGKSGTITYQLSEDAINSLASNNMIDWKENKGSYSGTIIISPEFDYVKNITVKVRETPEGTLKYNGKTLKPGNYTFHYGDKLTFEPNVTDEAAAVGMRAVGIGYESRKGSAAGALTGKEDCNYFTDKGVTYTLTEDYYEFWQVFSDVKNAVRVRVPDEDVQYFDLTKGIFADATSTSSDGYTMYELKTSVLTNEFIELLAFTRDENHVPVWTLPNNSNTYSGSGFCFFAGVKAPDNLVTLSADRNESSHAWYSVSGTACTSTLNLSTGNDADDLFPAEGAIFTSGSTGAWSDENGSFTMQPVYLKGGSHLRYAVSYNGVLSIQEVGVAPADAEKTTVDYLLPTGNYASKDAVPVSLGNVKLSGWSPVAAHFSNVEVYLDGFNSSAIHAVEMSGKSLTLSVTVDPGQKYIFDGKEYEEHITDVTLYFQSQITGDIHGVYSTTLKEGESEPGLKWDAGTNTATLKIDKFSPDAPDKYTWGDVVMLQLTTDKRVSVQEDPGMMYQPVSSGYAVITDKDYVPETFDYKVDIAAMLSDAALSDDSENGNTRYSFGKFPWLGEISAVIWTFSYFTSSTQYNEAQQILDDLELMENDGDAELAADGVVPKRWALSAAVAFKETPYGGVRTMIAVAGTWGNSTYSKRSSPYRQFDDFNEYFYGKISDKGVGGNLIYNEGTIQHSRQQKRDYIRSEFGGGYIHFSVYVGIYIDWGFIEVAKTDGSGETEISHEACFLGAGGFVGGKLTAGYTAYAFILLPVYFNIEAGIDVTLYIGSEADPNKTLQSFYETTDHKGQDFDLEIEVLGDVSISASVGVGLFKLLGARATGGLGLQAGYSLRTADWYPDLEGANTLSYSTDAMFSGTLDLIVTSIDLWSASWPLPLGYGWLQFFQQTRRANTLIHFVNTGINEGNGSEAVRNECRRMADELGSYMDAGKGTGDALMERVDELRDYAYNNNVISLTQWRRINMIRQGGIIGNIMDTATLTSDEETGSFLFHTREHVDTEWVAGQNAELMAAFGPVRSSKIMNNTISQSASQIMALGDNQFLVVFLDDDNTRDRQQANVLKWTVYNADRDTWTTPATVQDDNTADGRANLIDAGDKLVLSWSSIAEDKYEELKNEVKEELNAKNGSEPSDTQVQEVLEADPTRVMARTDIFSVQFDKKTKNFGKIEQLTDDDYYDDVPQAVYDDRTGDYIVLYYKTAQDTEKYSSAEDRLKDLVSSNTDPEKTYSVLCYMLYNNQTDAEDTRGQTHGAGWARDYLYSNETNQDINDQISLLNNWGGQRFLPSALQRDGDDQSDPAIADLTVCNGYNGLATFAYTVDKDYDVDTAKDKELYVQFYRFADHSTYVPVKVAGEAEKETVNSAQREKQANGSYRTTEPASVTKAPAAVDVGQPKLIRNEDSTWLFWREDNDGLRYINISEMLNTQVPKVENPGKNDEDWVYVVQEDGSFAIDPGTGKSWAPEVQKVDFGSAMTDEDLNISDYQVITDKDDNLYVVWTDVYNYEESEKTDLGETITSPAQAIYATAKIKEADLKTIRTSKDDNGKEATYETVEPAVWSKPYRLTRDNSSNDGVTLALDEDGGLILLHNQYKLELADTEQEIEYMLDNHLAGIYEDDGKSYFLGYPYYPSDLSLMLTRFESIGSVEATQFSFSDNTPVAGDKVDVTAVIENTGLTTAKAAEVDFYAYKDGKQVTKLKTESFNEEFPVNTAQTVSFQWTVPEDGADGYSIQAVAREKKSRIFGGEYNPVETFSNEFAAAPDYTLNLESCVQNGDVFDVKYTVENTGNIAVPEGTKANLYLEGLYGDLRERYGMDTDLLVEEDISGLAPGETRKVKKSITLPVSVFTFCGYDAVTVEVVDKDDTTLAVTNHNFITLDEPLNLTLNNGSALSLNSGESAAVPATYDSTLFMDQGGVNATKVLYSVDDPAIATVDENGNVTGLGKGTTTLTATLLPSGRSESIKVRVASEGGSGGGTGVPGNRVILPDSISGGSASSSAKQAKAGKLVTITVNPEEGYETETVNVTDADGNPVEVTDNGDGTYSFTMPASEVKVDPVFRKTNGSGDNVCPRDNTCPMTPFTDVDKQEWYHDGVHWAIEKGIMNGTGENIFEPLTSTSRAMIVTMLWRMEGSPQTDGTVTFTDVPDGQWYTDAVKWASANGIVTGYSEKVFAPMDDVTREQIVTILYRYAQFKGADVSKGETAYLNNYTDARNIAEWAVKAFRWAVDEGVIQGMSETTLGPKSDAVRAQVATMLMRFKNLI